MSEAAQKSLVHAVIALGLALVYAQVLGHEFINLDDDQYVSSNPVVSSGLTVEGIAWAFGEFHSFNWHPLTWLSHMLDVELFGLNAGAHHAVNVLFHIANSMLLFHVFAIATRRIGPAAVVAGLFAFHPAHVESVAWIAERKDLLSTFFGLLSIQAYIAYTRDSKRRSFAWVVAFFVASLLSKPMLVTLPFVLLLLDVWPLRRIDLDPALDRGALLARLREKLPLFGLGIASIGVTLAAQATGGAMQAGSVLTTGDRIGNALVSYVRYFGKAAVPKDLAIYYPHPGGWSPWVVLCAAVLLLVVSALVVRQLRARPYLAVGWFWYLGTLVPVIGLVQVGSQSIADRYTYVPYVGLSIAIVFGVAEGCRGNRRCARAAAVVAAATGIVFGLLSWEYVGAWQNSITIFTHALMSTDDAYPAMIGRGPAPTQPGQPPHNGLYTPYYNLGTAYAEAQRFEEAQRHFEAAIVAHPGFPEVYINMGVVLAQQGDLQGSRRYYEKALEIDPGNALAARNLGILREMMRR